MTPEMVKIPLEEHSEAQQGKEQPTGIESSEDPQQQIEKYKDRWLRAEAEVQNMRRWLERRLQDRVAAERERLLRAFLTVADNLERALDSEAPDDSLRDGVALTHRELLRFLSTEGVSPIQEVVGQPFDPLYHEAVATVPSSDEEGKVVEQTQKGYLLNGRPLRPARVVVACSGKPSDLGGPHSG